MGPMIRHIRDIRVVDYTKTGVRSCLHQLKQAKLLRSITLDTYLCATRSASNIAEAFRPFVKAIRKLKAQDDHEDDIIDTIDVTPRNKRLSEARFELDRKDKEYAANIRSELKKALA